MAALATATFRDDVLLVLFSTNPSSSLLGTLYAIIPQSRASSGAIISSSPNSPLPSNSSRSSAVFTISSQYIIGSTGIGIGSTAALGATMVSTSLQDNSLMSYRHDLLLAFSSLTSTSVVPTVIRLVPQYSNMGDGNSIRHNMNVWGIASDPEDTLLLSKNMTALWMASGNSFTEPSGSSSGSSVDPSAYSSGSSTLEGSALYEVYRPADMIGLYTIQKLNVYTQDEMGRPVSQLIWSRAVGSLDASVPPKVVRFIQGGIWDGVVVGACKLMPGNTCLALFNDTGLTSITTDSPFDSNACLAADYGSLVMATSSQVFTLDYNGVASTDSTASWTTRLASSNGSTDRILACSARLQTFYAVKNGGSSIPTINTLDFSNSSSWTWQTAALIPGTNSASTSSDSSAGSHHGIAPGIVAIIAVVAAIVLSAVGFFLMRRSKAKKALRLKQISVPRTLISPAPLLPTQNTTHSAATAAAIPLQPIHHTGSYSAAAPYTSAPRANSWSSEGSVAAAGVPGSAAFNHRSSMPIQSSGVVTNSGPPLGAGTAYYAVSMLEQQPPLIATSLSAAPYGPFMVPSSPIAPASPTVSNINRASQQQQQGERGYGEASGSSSSAAEAASLLRLSNILYPDEPVRSQRSSRLLQETLSPTLANAQLILQQSQQP